ncbi:hypothetical protein OAP01_00765 [Akkermansiaceae bacterium]|nr:hypothetical protein [Akkermansiaceae bacterium]
MKRGRKAGSSDFVYVTRELILKAADALAGHRRDKQVPISKAWLESSGYDLVPVAAELVEGEKKAEEAEERRKNSSRLDNVATVQPKLTAGQQSGPTDVFVPWKSIQHLFKDQELYEDAFKIFGKILGVSDWKKLPLKGIRGDVVRAIDSIDELRKVVGSDNSTFAMMQRDTNLAGNEFMEALKTVPTRYLRAFVEATEGMAPDLPLEDVRRYLGKRKRVSEVPCKNIQSLSLF